MDGHLLFLAHEDGSVALVDVSATTPELIKRGVWRAHCNAVFDLALDHDERTLYTASGDLTARAWDLATSQNVAILRGNAGHLGSIKAIAPHPRSSDMVATGGRDGALFLWDLRSPGQSHDRNGVLSREPVAAVRAAHTNKPLVTLGVAPSPSFAAVSPTYAALLRASAPATTPVASHKRKGAAAVATVALVTPPPVSTPHVAPPAPKRPASTVALRRLAVTNDDDDSDGDDDAAADDDVLDTDTGLAVATGLPIALPASGPAVSFIAPPVAGRRRTGSVGAAGAAAVAPTVASGHGITTVAFLHHDHLLASACAFDSVVKVWDVRKLTPTPLVALSPTLEHTRSRGVATMTLDSTRTILAASSLDHRVYVYDTTRASPLPVQVLGGHHNTSFYIKSAFSADDRYLLTGGSDWRGYMWQVQVKYVLSSPFIDICLMPCDLHLLTSGMYACVVRRAPGGCMGCGRPAFRDAVAARTRARLGRAPGRGEWSVVAPQRYLCCDVR